jgi:hypothetical protein
LLWGVTSLLRRIAGLLRVDMLLRRKTRLSGWLRS